jgi:predicted DNA-binding protein (UPF0251 family)/predicted Fe-Mo cluster-binding NifX family protein
VDFFKPRGIPMRELEEACLSVEGLEALRLADVEGLTMQEAAAVMEVSRHTFGRVLAQARTAVARALTEGRALRIEGGHWAVKPQCRKGSGQAPRNRETTMSKIAVTSEGPTLDSQIDPRFGRAAGFVVVDPATWEFQYVDNGASQAMSQGAGINAAEAIARAGATALLTGYVGPKAFAALQAAGIAVIQDMGDMTVRQAVEEFAAGRTTAASAPNR